MNFIFPDFLVAIGGATPSWTLPGFWVLGSATPAMWTALGYHVPVLASFSTDDWRLVLEIVLGVLVVIGFFKPTPPLNQQFASKEELEKHRKEIWEVIKGLRSTVGRIEKDIAGMLALREANGERLDEISGELTTLIKEVAKLNERSHHSTGGHSHS